MNDYLDILRSWERRVANPFIYEHLDQLLPRYAFRRMQQGTARDRWVSPLKMDLSEPKVKHPEKTVVGVRDLRMREQGDWSNSVGVTDILMREKGFENVYQLYSWLSERYSLGMPMPDSKEVKSAAARRERREGVLQALAEYFVWCLENAKTEKAARTRAYLKNGRGFTDGQIKDLGFGFVPLWSSVVTYMTVKRKFRKDDLDAVCQVCGDDGRTAVGKTHTLAIPYVCSGVLKGFIFRRVDGGDPPKYLANAGLDRRSEFFNYPVEGSGVIAVVEGEMDALTATAAGIPGVVAIGGSDISGDRKMQVVSAFSRGTKKIILCPDLDIVKTGKGSEVKPNYEKRLKAVMRSVHTVKDVDFDFDEIYVALFPEPSDPDEFIRKYGRDAFLGLLREAKPWWRYLADEKELLKVRDA